VVKLSVSVMPAAVRKLVQTFSRPSIGVAKMLPSSRTCGAATRANIAPDSSRNAPVQIGRKERMTRSCSACMVSPLIRAGGP
jgi:hypothetical protein